MKLMRCQFRIAPRGLTLVEILVSLVIVSILASTVVLTGRMVRNSRMRATAEQQMAMLATAIEQYAAFWPRWEVLDATGELVVVADKGWPDFIPGRLFLPVGSGGPFSAVPGFNDVGGTPDPLVFDVTDIIYSSARRSFDGAGGGTPGRVLNANSCLAYCLTSQTGKGPFVEDKPGANLVDMAVVHKQGSPMIYPAYSGLTEARRREVFVDPWGTPYRYFWVYRDPDPDSNARAYKGFLPVDYAPFLAGIGVGGVSNPSFFDATVPAVRKKAAAFVLESAGPDKRFGNVWKRAPTQTERDEAEDNLTIVP